MITGALTGIVRPLCALVLVIFVGLIWLLALVLGEARRTYALEVSSRGIEFARVLVGTSRAKTRTTDVSPRRRST